MGYPDPDPVGQHPGTAGSDIVARARGQARRLLLSAAHTDREGLTRAALDGLGQAGLLGLAAPPEWGGTAASTAEWREVAETLMAADGTAWFCWSQHHALVRTLAAARVSDDLPHVGDLRRDLLPALASGAAVAAVAFSHARRSGPPALVAEPAPGGWTLHGTVGWVTAWDIADVVMVLAEADGRLLHFVLPTEPTVGLDIGPPHRLLAMSGSHTRPLAFAGVVVPDRLLVAAIDRPMWLSIDRVLAAQPPPAAFGLARGALSSMATLSDAPEPDRLGDVLSHVADETRALREACYSAVDTYDPRGSALPDLVGLRARAIALAARVAAIAMAARGPAGLLSGSADERRCREAAFLSVFRQGGPSRSALLDLWSVSPLPRD